MSDASGLKSQPVLRSETGGPENAGESREPDGKWKPGESGNPGGRPRSDHAVTELAKAHTTEAIGTLVEIMSNPEASPNSRVVAANHILNRGWGMPRQAVALSGEDTLPLSISVNWTNTKPEDSESC